MVQNSSELLRKNFAPRAGRAMLGTNSVFAPGGGSPCLKISVARLASEFYHTYFANHVRDPESTCTVEPFQWPR
jgi:hypothetical protein